MGEKGLQRPDETRWWFFIPFVIVFRLQECDMPHSQGVRLCLLDSEFSTLAKALAKVQVEVYQIKKAYLQIQAPDAGFHFNSDWTLTFCTWYCTAKPCTDIYLRVCDKQCSWSKHPLTISLLPLVVKGRWWRYKWVSGGDWGKYSCSPGLGSSQPLWGAQGKRRTCKNWPRLHLV